MVLLTCHILICEVTNLLYIIVQENLTKFTVQQYVKYIKNVHILPTMTLKIEACMELLLSHLRGLKS